MEIRSPELILASYSWARRLHMVRFTRARPFSVVRAWVTRLPSGSAQAGGPRLRGGHAQGHLFVVEGDHIDFERHRRLPGFRPMHLADAVRRIDDMIADPRNSVPLLGSFSSAYSVSLSDTKLV